MIKLFYERVSVSSPISSSLCPLYMHSHHGHNLRKLMMDAVLCVCVCVCVHVF
jgi:hypothetical protein